MTSKDLWNVTMETNDAGDYSYDEQRLALLKYQWKNLAQWRAWPEGDFIGNTRGSQRVESRDDRCNSFQSRATISSDTTREKVRKSKTIGAPLAENVIL